MKNKRSMRNIREACAKSERVRERERERESRIVLSGTYFLLIRHTCMHCITPEKHFLHEGKAMVMATITQDNFL
jgi:hypothetical protein